MRLIKMRPIICSPCTKVITDYQPHFPIYGGEGSLTLPLFLNSSPSNQILILPLTPKISRIELYKAYK